MATVTPVTCGSPLGRVVAISTPTAAPMSITFDGKPLQNMGLCTRLTVNQRVIAQFQNTFDDFIYITPFGDSAGDLQFDFIVNKSCDTTKVSLDAIDYYIKNRLRPTLLTSTGIQRSLPVLISVGNLTMRGFIVGLDINGTTSEGAIVRATLLMKGWPV